MSTWRLFIILLICGIGYPSEGSAETPLIIATGELPPYVSTNPKESVMTEVFNELGRLMDVTFVFRFMPWKRCESAVQELEAWGAIPYVLTPEREKKYYFSDKLFNREGKFFYYSRKGTPKQIPFAVLSDLKGYIIGGVIGYYYEKTFLDAKLSVEYVAEDEQNFWKLRAGKVDLIIADEIVGRYIIRKRFPLDVEKFFTISKPLDVIGDYLITSKKYPDTQKLLIKFNLALEKIKGNGTYQRILDQYGVVLTY
ncbi:MAG: transporter substrate-binding domain-containing protein [Desulfobacteraceae bacterium]|jgi:polar amino acid transport system substrate-binding protein